MDTEYYHTSLTPSDGTDGVQASVEITVPENALIGNTRLRIIKDMWNVYEDGEFNACLNAYYGQVEDYGVTVSEPLANTKFASGVTASLHPNPTSGLLHIESSATLEHYEVYNVVGQAVLRGTSALLNLDAQPQGVYLVKIQWANGTQTTHKVVKS